MVGAGKRGTVRLSRRDRVLAPGPLLLLISACGLPGGEGPSPGDPCRVSWGEGGGVALPVIGVVDPVDFGRAPDPRSDGEGLLFATVHPPMVRLDCMGRLYPGVAAGWVEEAGGDGEVGWRLRIPGGGERVDAVAGALTRGTVQDPGLTLAGVERVPSGVVVRLRGQGVREDGPRVLAERGLTPVVATDDGWGSRLSGLRLEPQQGPGPGRTLHLRGDAGDGELPLAAVRVVPGADPRDLLDQGVDLVLTRDPLAVAWAEAREGFRVLPLPPDRSYRMALPAGGLRELPDGLSAGLVRDVVPLGQVPSPAGGAGVGAAGTGAAGGGSCPASPGVAPSGDGRRELRPRVVHPAGDPVARALSQRVAALAGPDSGAPLSPLRVGMAGRVALMEVVGLDPGRFQAALQEGGDVAYVFPEPLNPAAPCGAAGSRARRIPWLAKGSLVSLLDTGPLALVRPGAPPLEVDGTGSVRLVFPGRVR